MSDHPASPGEGSGELAAVLDAGPDRDEEEELWIIGEAEERASDGAADPV